MCIRDSCGLHLHGVCLMRLGLLSPLFWVITDIKWSFLAEITLFPKQDSFPSCWRVVYRKVDFLVNYTDFWYTEVSKHFSIASSPRQMCIVASFLPRESCKPITIQSSTRRFFKYLKKLHGRSKDLTGNENESNNSPGNWVRWLKNEPFVHLVVHPKTVRFHFQHYCRTVGPALISLERKVTSDAQGCQSNDVTE